MAIQFKPFREWAAQLCPAWLRGDWGEKLVKATGLVFDMMVEEIRLAGEASLMDSPDFAPDALVRIGLERRMPRFPLDTDATYKARLKNAWVAWQQGGTRQGVLAQLTAMGLSAELFENFEWDWDSDTDNWSRFWVVLEPTPFARWFIGDGHTVGLPTTIGTTASIAQVRSIRDLIRQWKPAHVVCANIILVHELEDWEAAQPDGTWGDEPNRNRAASYWRG